MKIIKSVSVINVPMNVSTSSNACNTQNITEKYFLKTLHVSKFNNMNQSKSLQHQKVVTKMVCLLLRGALFHLVDLGNVVLSCYNGVCGAANFRCVAS